MRLLQLSDRIYSSLASRPVCLAELTKRKVKVIFCDEKRNPSSELVGYYGSHDTSNKIRKQIAVETEYSKDSCLDRNCDLKKSESKRELLELLGKGRSLSFCHSYLQQIAWNDETNQGRACRKSIF